MVNDTFTYSSAASFCANWKYAGSGVSFTAQEPGLSLANSLAYRDFSATRVIQPQQGWTISCAMTQTNYQRAQWVGLFTQDMCHGYLVRWDSSSSTAYNGRGFYAIYQYNSKTPVTDWNAPLGTPLATVEGNQLAVATVPMKFQMGASWDLSTGKRHLSMTAVNNSNVTAATQVEVADTDTRLYTRIVLSGNTTGIFNNLSLTAASTVYNVKSFGATGNGVTDDTVAIQNAINSAEANGATIYIPGTSASYIYSNNIYVTGTTLYGDGVTSLLQSTNPLKSAIVLQGDHVVLNNIKITSPKSNTVGRQSTGNSSGVYIFAATNFIVENVTINTTASVGILSETATGVEGSPSIITNCNVSNTLADGIHITNKSCYITESNNSVTNSGDDMYAVVSYTRDGGMCHDIVISNNTGSVQSAPGRGISVVGGENITILGNNIQKTNSAGIYLASELTRNSNGTLLYKEYGDNNIIVENNTLNMSALTAGQGAIQICGRPADTNPLDVGQTETAPMLITNAVFTGNTVTNATHSGICLDGYFSTISFEGNTVNTTAQQGLYVFGGSNLYVGDEKGNTFENIGTYGVYTGITSTLSYTTGTIDIENNAFDNVNILGTIPIPVISIGSSTAATCTITNNTINEAQKLLLLALTVRFNVL